MIKRNNMITLQQIKNILAENCPDWNVSGKFCVKHKCLEELLEILETVIKFPPR